MLNYCPPYLIVRSSRSRTDRQKRNNNCIKAASAFCCQSSAGCAVTSTEFLRTSGLLCCRSDDVELSTETVAWSCPHQWHHLHLLKTIFFSQSTSVYSALGDVFIGVDALYKFVLLTYLLTTTIIITTLGLGQFSGRLKTEMFLLSYYASAQRSRHNLYYKTTWNINSVTWTELNWTICARSILAWRRQGDALGTGMAYTRGGGYVFLTRSGERERNELITPRTTTNVLWIGNCSK